MRVINRITSEALLYHNMSVLDGREQVYNKALAVLKEKAVLANADGWQSSVIELQVQNNSVNLGQTVVYYMDMYKEVGDALISDND